MRTNFLLALVVGCFFSLNPVSAFAQQSSAVSVEVTQSMIDESIERVLPLLRDPYSARFSDWKAIYSEGTGHLDICGKVNAKNAYGGYSGAAWFVVSESPSKVLLYDNSASGATASNGIIKVLCQLQ